ncbi:sigma-54-dependent Fis family transcriptional regulator [candidate division KSB1 bacterium]|nr:sigma-54-dependent Fis family transcriptional regulator [candidate division KSB1 bacterium]
MRKLAPTLLKVNKPKPNDNQIEMNMNSSSSKDKILIADDEENIVEGLGTLLQDQGYEVVKALDGLAAQDKLKENEIGVALVDLVMPKLDGFELFARMKKNGSITQFIFITGQGSVSTAVEAMKAGAYDYLTKPVETIRLLSLIPKAMDHYNLLLSHWQLENELKNIVRFDELIGQSKRMQEIYQMITAVADSTANVLITGESGTGKELVAKAIHRKSGRSGSFIAINCAAFPKDILENELFGHEKGAFTGALQEKQGCFELAHGGTLFLDEIGDMPVDVQAKFLRALEEKKFRRLGGKKEIKVDIRILAATNQEPRKTLREDLYYRLSVVEMELPPLRERLEDMQVLIKEFLQYFNQRNSKKIQSFSVHCMNLMMNYSWPGNVRELRNVIERSVLLSPGKIIETDVLPNRLLENAMNPTMVSIALDSSLADIEKTMIVKNLERVNYNKTKAAMILGVSLKTLYNKMGKYGIKVQPTK